MNLNAYKLNIYHKLNYNIMKTNSFVTSCCLLLSSHRVISATLGQMIIYPLEDICSYYHLHIFTCT